MRKRRREFWTKVVDECERTSGETHAGLAARDEVKQYIQRLGWARVRSFA